MSDQPELDFLASTLEADPPENPGLITWADIGCYRAFVAYSHTKYFGYVAFDGGKFICEDWGFDDRVLAHVIAEEKLMPVKWQGIDALIERGK